MAVREGQAPPLQPRPWNIITPFADLSHFKIQMNVSAYYAQVDDILRQYGREGVIDFDMFCAQVKVSFQKLKRRQIPQKVIFDNLVKWLVDSTHEELEPCETVIAYFVQKCEVFDVITEQAVLI